MGIDFGYSCRRVILIILIFAVVFAMPWGIGAKADNAEAQLILQGFESIARNNHLSLYADLKSGKIAVLENETGYIWRSNPENLEKDSTMNDYSKKQLSSQLTVTYLSNDEVGGKYRTDVLDNYSASIQKNAFKAEKVTNGIKFVFEFPDLKFVVPVRYTIENDYFKAALLLDEMVSESAQQKLVKNSFTKEDNVYPYRNLISEVSLLPYFGAADTSQEGYMLVPDGPGGLIKLNNGKSAIDSYRQTVFGTDRVITGGEGKDATLSARMPVFGMKTGNHALFGIIDKCESVGFVQASVSGKISAYNNIYSGMQLRYYDGINISRVTSTQPAYEVRYYPLSSRQADYSGMAGRYQKYLIEEKGLQRNEAKEGLLQIDLYGGVKKQKYFWGIPFKTIEPLTTYRDCMDIVADLKASGVGQALIIYNAWMQGGLRSKIPQALQYENALGGKRAFDDLLRFASNSGVMLFPAVDLVNIYEPGNGYSQLFDSIQRINTSPGYQYYKLRNTQDLDIKLKWSILKFDFMNKAVNKFFAVNDKKIVSNLYMKSLADTISSDFSPNGIVKGDGDASLKNALSTADQYTSNMMTDWANSYALPYTQYMTGVPVEGNGYDIVDEYIPFYQMTVHGYIQYSTPAFNLCNDPYRMFLKAVETGSAMKYSWIGKDVVLLQKTELNWLYSGNYRNWKNDVVFNYKRMAEIYSLLYKKTIIHHRMLAANVYETAYENNIRVIVNYNEKDTVVEGRNVKGKDFIVVRGE